MLLYNIYQLLLSMPDFDYGSFTSEYNFSYYPNTSNNTNNYSDPRSCSNTGNGYGGYGSYNGGYIPSNGTYTGENSGFQFGTPAFSSLCFRVPN